MAKRTASKDRPYIDNYPPLKALLAELEARCHWQTRPDGYAVGDDDHEARTYVECWITPQGREFLVVVHGGGHGWNIYTPCASGKVDETVADAKARLAQVRS